MNQQWKVLREEKGRWSPWAVNKNSDTKDRHEHAGERTLDEKKLLGAWRLRGQCLQIATYYRVMHANARALARERMKRMRARFQSWAVSFIGQQRDAAANEAIEDAVESERQRRGDRVSSSTRMTSKPAGVYRAGVRAYKTRTPQLTIDKRRLRKKPCRAQIMNAAEIGPRLYENYTVIAERCAIERKMRDDG